MEKKDKISKWKKTDSGYLKIFLIFFVIGNLFFLSSNAVFHGTSSIITPTKYEEPLSWNGRVIQLIRWEYDPSRKLMEVELSIEENISLDGVKNYQYVSNEYKAGAMKVNAVAETDDMLIVQIENVPKNYTILSLHVNTPEGDPEEDLVVYGNNHTVHQTYIEERTVNEYAVAKAERTIEKMKQNIVTSKKVIEEQCVAIENGNSRISELNEKLEYQVGEEYEKTQSQITEITTLVNRCYQTIEKEELLISSYELQIESAKALLVKYAGSGENG